VPLNILVVDDSTMMRAMIKRAIQMSGVDIGEIYEAPDGQAALTLLEVLVVLVECLSMFRWSALRVQFQHDRHR